VVGFLDARGHRGLVATFPHCDELVLHAPGECEFCDRCPEAQADRERRLINFTGHSEPHKEKCPSEVRRPLESIERWGGNVASRGGTLKPHSEPPETLAWGMYGERAEPAHPAVNRPREVLMAALIEDARPLVDDLRRKGWPVEVIAVAESDFVGIRFQVDLLGMHEPIETTTGEGDHGGASG
jgi:hypothetical protein